MRKAVCLVVSAILLAAGLLAGAAEADSLAGLAAGLEFLAQTDDSGVFDYEKCQAVVGEDGEVILRMVSLIPWATYEPNLQDAVVMVSDLWKQFNDVHTQRSTVPFFVDVWHGEELLFTTDGTMVVDFTGAERPMAFTPE